MKKNYLKLEFKCLFFACMLIIVSCSKDKDENDSSNLLNNSSNNDITQVTINSTPRFTGTVNGIAVSYIEGSNNVVSSCGSDGNVAPYPDPSEFKYSSSLYDDNTYLTYLNVKLGTLIVPNGGYPSETQFNSFFTTGTKPYTQDAENGVSISMMDNNFDVWSTEYGTGDQSGYSFKIDQVKQETIAGTYSVKVKASFSCKLYKYLSGEEKTITNGVFIGYFGKI